MAHLINLSHEDIGSEDTLEGYKAFDATGEKIGEIDSVIAEAGSMQLRYLVVDSGGWFRSKKFVVPAGDVQRVDDGEGCVTFRSLSKQALESGGYPKYDDQWWETNDYESFRGHERDVAAAYGTFAGGARTTPAAQAEVSGTRPGNAGGGSGAYVHSPGQTLEERTGQPDVTGGTGNATGTSGEYLGMPDYTSDLYRRPREGAERLQLMEERLQVNKNQFEAGRVRLGKHIVERTETVNVPVREERVVIERTPGSGEVSYDGRNLDEGETIEVPVMREEVEVTKTPVVAEEVGLRKESRERSEQVQETLRREELDVEGDDSLMAEPPSRSETEVRR